MLYRANFNTIHVSSTNVSFFKLIDEVKIVVWDDGSRFRRSADDTIIPAQNLEVSFSVKQHPVKLRLTRNDDLKPEVPVYTANEDGIIKEDIKDDHVLFILLNLAF